MTEQQYKVSAETLQAEINKLRADYLALVHENAGLQNQLQMAQARLDKAHDLTRSASGYLAEWQKDSDFVPRSLINYIKELDEITYTSKRVKEIINEHKKVV